jgi:hypothetical protein
LQIYPREFRPTLCFYSTPLSLANSVWERIRWKSTHQCKLCKLRSRTQVLDPKATERGEVILHKPARLPRTGLDTFAITPSRNLPQPLTRLPPLQASGAAPLSSPCPTRLPPLRASASRESKRVWTAAARGGRCREQRQNRRGGRPSARAGAMTEGRAGAVT